MKEKIVYFMFLVGLLIILFSAFYPTEKLISVCTFLLCALGLIQRKFFTRDKKKLSKWYHWFIAKDDFLDEREKLIWLKSNQISFFAGILTVMVFFLLMKDSLNAYNQFRFSWIYWCIGIILLVKSISAFIYYRFVKIEL